MILRDRPDDVRRFDILIRRAYTVTLLGVSMVLLITMWVFVPIQMPGVFLSSIETSHGEKAPQFEHDVNVAVTAAGELYLGQEPVTHEALTAALTRAAQPRRYRDGEEYFVNVFVRVDKRASFGAVRTVVVAAQNAKLTHLTFLANEKATSAHGFEFSTRN
jgi:biopolymer transport protein ExbD